MTEVISPPGHTNKSTTSPCSPNSRLQNLRVRDNAPNIVLTPDSPSQQHVHNGLETDTSSKSPPRAVTPSSLNTTGDGTSPRFEAFVMTGEKILRLNSKVSTNFAKAKQSELPSHTEVVQSPGESKSPSGTLRSAPNSAQLPLSGEAVGEPVFLSGAQRAKKHIAAGRAAVAASTPNVPKSQSEDVNIGDTPQPGNNRPTRRDQLSHQFDTGLSPHMGQGSSFSDNEDSQASCVTVDAMCRGGMTGMNSVTTMGSDANMLSLNSPNVVNNELQWPQSEPSTPARNGTARTNQAGSASTQSPRGKRDSEQTGGRRKSNSDEVDTSVKILRTVSGDSDGSMETATIIRVGSNDVAYARSGPATQHLDDVIPDEPISPLRERLLALGNGLSRSQKDPDPEAATRLAGRLYRLEGFDKNDVASHLSKNNDFCSLVAREYLRQFNFGGLRIDAALRKFLTHVALMGESSERERILVHFSCRYHDCNPGIFESEDSVHTLACALLLLNTDLHGPNLGKRMSCHEFIDNISYDKFQYSRDLLKSLFQAIKRLPIEWIDSSKRATGSTSETTPKAEPQVDDRFLEIPDPDSQVEYKKGWIMRKCVVDIDGKRTPRGRRGWKMLYGTIKGLILYLHKDENMFRKGAFQTFTNCIRIHHVLATKAQDYSKRMNVFRLLTANYGEYLFQTSDPEELDSWIESLNYVSACFSSPPLPEPVGSRSNYCKPVLPSTSSKLPLPEQLRQHERRVADTEAKLEDLRTNPPTRAAKAQVKQEYSEVIIFLQTEATRYKTYVELLTKKLTEHMASSMAAVSITDHVVNPYPAQLSTLPQQHGPTLITEGATGSPVIRRAAGTGPAPIAGFDRQVSAEVTTLLPAASSAAAPRSRGTSVGQPEDGREVEGANEDHAGAQADRLSYKTAIYNSVVEKNAAYETSL